MLFDLPLNYDVIALGADIVGELTLLVCAIASPLLLGMMALAAASWWAQ